MLLSLSDDSTLREKQLSTEALRIPPRGAPAPGSDSADTSATSRAHAPSLAALPSHCGSAARAGSSMRCSQLWGPRLLSQHSLDPHRAFRLRIPTAMAEAAQKRLHTSPRVQSLDTRCKGTLSPGG